MSSQSGFPPFCSCPGWPVGDLPYSRRLDSLQNKMQVGCNSFPASTLLLPMHACNALITYVHHVWFARSHLLQRENPQTRTLGLPLLVLPERGFQEC